MIKFCYSFFKLSQFSWGVDGFSLYSKGVIGAPSDGIFFEMAGNLTNHIDSLPVWGQPIAR